MNAKGKYTILTWALVALCFGCDDPLEVSPTEATDCLRFSTTLEGVANASVTRTVGGYATAEISDWEDRPMEMKKETRSAPLTSLTGYASIFGYAYDGTFDASARVLTNGKYQFDGEILVPDQPFAWTKIKDKEKALFCSYAPYQELTSMQIRPAVDSNGNPGITYTVPSDVHDQTDFLYAFSGEIEQAHFREIVPFNYKHSLTAIQFRMGFKDVTVKSVSVKQVAGHGLFTFAQAALNNSWASVDTPTDYTLDFGEGIAITAEQQWLTKDSMTLMLIPQSFDASSTATIEMTYTDAAGDDHTISASLAGSDWIMGKRIVYTLNKEVVNTEYVFFDLIFGAVAINADGYSGALSVNGKKYTISKTGLTPEEMANTKFFIYQSINKSTSSNHMYKTGFASEADMAYPERIKLPSYDAMTVTKEGKTMSWAEFITNNKDVNEVITTRNSLFTSTGRTQFTDGNKFLGVYGTGNYDVTIYNIFPPGSSNRDKPAILFDSKGAGTLTLRLKGDNFVHEVQYRNTVRNGGKLIITSCEGDDSRTGTLTMVPKNVNALDNNNHSVIGPSAGENCYGITIKGGTIYSGVPPVNDMIWGDRSGFKYTSCIGGGVNHAGEVIITGGRVTSVSNGTSAAIGGGGGYESGGSEGYVTITGGEVYAYAVGPYTTLYGGGYVPCTAIGGSGSIQVKASGTSEINISGGYVYAESLGGSAIGGGNSYSGVASHAIVNISGTAQVVARSVSGTAYNGLCEVNPSTSIGGGTSIKQNGGDAWLNISGGQLFTGSVGGGSTGDPTMNIGTAQITISGNPTISGQFVMAKATTAPSFTMSGGTIINSETTDLKYPKIQSNGGAVYMEEGECTITGGTIRNCMATEGGAIYMTGGTFTMSGGAIYKNTASTNGGGVSIRGGDVKVSGGTIEGNIASDGNGGGVFITGGNFDMPHGSAGQILRNESGSLGNQKNGNGGGVYVTSTGSVSVNIITGAVKGNSADNNGGGMCVNIDAESASADIQIGAIGGTVNDPNISENSAATSGGGLCVLGDNAHVSINSGTVKGNVSAYVKNEDIRNDGGTVSLTGDESSYDVKYNTITFHSNYKSTQSGDDGNQSATQRIVTSTNSRLAPPAEAQAWSREFFSFKEWNTKKDGSGTAYTHAGGETMNIATDLHLYAIWVAN